MTVFMPRVLADCVFQDF